MQDHEELKMIRMREEMEQAAQKTLFDERMRLTSQFSEERATLEQQLFEVQEAKQVLEEEILTWKGACEKEQEDNRSMKLQHDRAEVLRKQKEEHVKREEKAKEGKLKLEKTKSENEERLDKEHAMRQIAKISTYLKSKAAVFGKICTQINPATTQGFDYMNTNYSGMMYVPGECCVVCWATLPSTQPNLRKLRAQCKTLGVQACIGHVNQRSLSFEDQGGEISERVYKRSVHGDWETAGFHRVLHDPVELRFVHRHQHLQA